MAVRRQSRSRTPYDSETLQQAALNYAARYATTRARLAAYLVRKLRERGWTEAGEPPVERLVEHMAELGYVDDQAFAVARGAALGRRGYGERRVNQALRAAGISDEDGRDARDAAEQDAFEAAMRFARRRRLGPFAEQAPDRIGRDKAVAAFLRAGHRLDLALKLVRARPGEIPDQED